jgi:hypothetical protein
VPQKLGRFTVAHLLEPMELADALLPRGGQPPHELCPQLGVGVLIRRSGDSVFYLRGVPEFQMRNDVAELGSSRF